METATMTVQEPVTDEQQKRKKLCKDFLSALLTRVPLFVKGIEDLLSKDYNLDVSSYEADHVCWRTKSMQEYSELVDALRKQSNNECGLLIESDVGGRPISTFLLKNGIEIDNQRSIKVLEIPSPKSGSPYPAGLEHVEFVIGKQSERPRTPVNNERHQSVLRKFMDSHKGVEWDTRAITKSINPDVSLKLNLENFGPCSVKFHLIPLADVIRYEKDLSYNEGMM